ncbi:MAG: ABC transporter permease, partial [Mesorhizobium sp.]
MTAIEEHALTLDPEEARRVRQERLERIGRWLLPLAIMVLAIWLWDRICVWNDIPKYILPRPGVVLQTLFD